MLRTWLEVSMDTAQCLMHVLRVPSNLPHDVDHGVEIVLFSKIISATVAFSLGLGLPDCAE